MEKVVKLHIKKVLFSVVVILSILAFYLLSPGESNKKPGSAKDPQITETLSDPLKNAQRVQHEHADEPHSNKRIKMEENIRKAVNEIVNTSSEGLVEKVAEDGSVSVDLQGRFKTVPVATIGEDGSIVIQDFSEQIPSSDSGK
jgi:hypothetical protein